MPRVELTPEQRQELGTAVDTKATESDRPDLGRPMFFHARAQFEIDQSKTLGEWVEAAYTNLIRAEAREARRDAMELQGRRLLNTMIGAKVAQGHERADIEPFLTAILRAWQEAGTMERSDLVDMVEDVARAI